MISLWTVDESAGDAVRTAKAVMILARAVIPQSPRNHTYFLQRDDFYGLLDGLLGHQFALN